VCVCVQDSTGFPKSYSHPKYLGVRRVTREFYTDKVHPRTAHGGPEEEQRYSSTPYSTSALDGSGCLAPRPRRFNHGRKTRYQLYRRLGGPQSRSTRVRKISAPTGIRSSDRPASLESLHRLRYPGPQVSVLTLKYSVPSYISWSSGICAPRINYTDINKLVTITATLSRMECLREHSRKAK
jgi:hypothetical protein